MWWAVAEVMAVVGVVVGSWLLALQSFGLWPYGQIRMGRKPR